MGKRAVFLDRDGVLNELVLNPKNGEHESPHEPDDVRMMAGACAAALNLQDAGFALFIISNQPSYAKGKTTLEKTHEIARRVEAALNEVGVQILRGLYCHHHPEGIVPGYSGACRCRKPKPQLLFDARDEFDVDLAESWMIGDQDSDVECGTRGGCRTVSVANPLSAKRRPGVAVPTIAANDLVDAAAKILAYEKQRA